MRKKKEVRKCAFPNCKTVLNQYNNEEFCYSHQRTVNQHGLIYVPKTYKTKQVIKVKKGFYHDIKARDPVRVSLPYLCGLKNSTINLEVREE